MKNILMIIISCTLLVSCQDDISGTYKALKPFESFEKEIIVIDGDSLTRSLYGKFSERYHGMSKNNKYYYITCTFPCTMQYQASLSKDGNKYSANYTNAFVKIDKEEFKSYSWKKDIIPDDSLISYFEKNLTEMLHESLNEKKKQGDDNVGFQFVVNENKLILVGGNEFDDYFIKLVE